MGKGLSMGMIQMYIGLIEDEYEPLINMLQAKTEAVKPDIEKQVKVDMGIYDLLMEKTAVETRLSEIKKKLSDLVGSYYDTTSCVQSEINKRLLDMNMPLKQAMASKEAALKKIKLMGAGDDVKQIFETLASEVALMAKEFENVQLIEAPKTKRMKRLTA